jgi:hypothetical protein
MYNTDPRRICENHARNMDRYLEGTHFYVLQGEELNKFKEYANCVVAPNVCRLYLWTEKGALLQAKSLNTDRAWEVYNELVDSYFRNS